jgi:undecaprenyl-diphosphatase
VGHRTLDPWWTLAVAAGGAILGDGLAFELGRRQEARMRSLALVQRNAVRIAAAEAFLARHGTPSIVLARFAGPVRAFVPLLAGFSKMPAPRFYVTNVLSAALWAPAHILPGVVFGASLQLAEAATGRLVLLLLILVVVLWVAAKLGSLTVRTLVPLAGRLRSHAFRFVSRHDTRPARLLRVFLDPEHPGSEAMLAGLALVLAAMWLFLAVLEDVVTGDPLVMADQSVYAFLQQLRTDRVDRIMVGLTELGSVGVLLPLVLAVAGWLAWRRAWRTAGYWLAAIASAQLVVEVLKWTLGRHRPLSLYRGIEQFSFPSGHATMTAVVIASLAFLVTRGQSLRWRAGVGVTAALYIVLVGFSRLYLGAHWLSDVLAGFAFGLAAVALLAIVYTQHRVQEEVGARRLAQVAGVAIAASAVVWLPLRVRVDLHRYTAAAAQQVTTLAAWANGGHVLLPSHRRELAGEKQEAFTVQIACPAPQLRAALAQAGWHDGPPLSAAALLQAITPGPELRDLPVLPKYDGGRESRLELVHAPPGANASKRKVLRLWRSDWEVTGPAGAMPVWYGSFYEQHLVRPNLGWIRDVPVPPLPLQSSGLARLAPGVTPELWTCPRP